MTKDDFDFLADAPPVPDAPEPEQAPEPESDTVVLVASNLPFYVTSFVVNGKTFDRSGTSVPADEVDQFIESAVAEGVALTRKDN